MKLFLLIGVFSYVCFASTFYISPFGNNQNSGTSPSSAFLDLETALNAAAKGDIIRAAAGVYTGSANTDLTINGVTLIGAGSTKSVFQGSSSTRADYIFILTDSGSVQVCIL